MTDTTRFAIPMPEDGDPPNLPAQLQTAAERIEVLLGQAGAQAKKSINTAAQSTTSSSFTLLGTPDRVQGLVVPTDGIIFILFHALWKESANGAAEAALFLGGNQLRITKMGPGSASFDPAGNVKVSTGLNMTPANRYQPLISGPVGLLSAKGASGDRPDPVTTGQIVGGLTEMNRTIGEIRFDDGAGWTGTAYQSGAPGSGIITGYGGICAVFAAAGTYDVSVQFKDVAAGGNTITAKQRRLWAWTKDFV